MKQYVMFGALMVLTCHQQKVCGQTVDWFTGGNNGLNPGTSFLGNTDGVPINFRTNNLLRMRLNNTMSYTRPLQGLLKGTLQHEYSSLSSQDRILIP